MDLYHNGYKKQNHDFLVSWKLNNVSFTLSLSVHFHRQSKTISLTDRDCFKNMEGLMRIEWTSKSHIKALLQAAGWPSALLWHKQRGHVLLLSAEGTPPHIFPEQATLAPYRGSFVQFLAFGFSGTAPYSQTPSTAMMWHYSQVTMLNSGLNAHRLWSLWEIRWKQI